jgi:hypothetical protein
MGYARTNARWNEATNADHDPSCPGRFVCEPLGCRIRPTGVLKLMDSSSETLFKKFCKENG